MTKATTPLELVQALLAKGLTQLEIEDRTGIKQSTVSKIKRGQIHEVRSGKYLALQSLYAELFPEEHCCPTAGALKEKKKRTPNDHPGDRATDRKGR